MKKFLALTLCLIPVLGASQTIIYSNNIAPGDDFTNAGGSNTGQAVGSSGWYYNNVRNNGHVGINNTFAHNGNGSAYLGLTQGPGGASSKADIEFFASASANGSGNYGATSALGTLGSLTSLSYDWYRAAGGTASAWLMPSIRIGVVSADLTQSGYLVFEREVQGGPYTAPTNSWVSENIFASDYRLWSSGSTLPFNLNGTNGTPKYYDSLRLSEWISSYSTFLVTSINLGVGSGWGTFEGAVDNVSFGFNGQGQTFNFEVASANPVPEPLTITLGIAGAIAAVRRRLKK